MNESLNILVEINLTKADVWIYLYKKLVFTNVQTDICDKYFQIFYYICHTLPTYLLKDKDKR